MLSSWIIVAYALMLSSWIWILYVLRNSYVIIVPGLKKLYIIFILHTWTLIFWILFFFLRPVWTRNVATFYFDHPWICHLVFRTAAFSTVTSAFLQSLFGFYKILFYKEVFPSDFKIRYNALKALLVAFFLFSLTIPLTVKTFPFKTDNTRHCMKNAPDVLFLICSCLWLLINSYTTYVSFLYYRLRDSAGDMLKRQIYLNMYIIPSIVFTSILARVVGLGYILDRLYQPNDETVRIFARMLPLVLDNFINNMFMYWFLFGSMETTFMTIDSSTSSSTRLSGSRSRSYSSENLLWISITGAHPVCMDADWVFQNGLESLILPDDLRRQQWSLRQRGFLCQSSSDDIAEFDEMQEIAWSQDAGDESSQQTGSPHIELAE